MALKSFGKGGNPDLDGPAGSASAPAAGPGGLTAFIDQGSEFEGKLSFRDTVRIDGCFRGEIASENTLIVGESGEIHASIRSNMVVISGNVDGNVHAARKLVLHKTARVNGDIETPSLVVEEGAMLNGQLKMVSSQDAKAAGGSAPLKAIPGGAPKPDAGKGEPPSGSKL
jgi:cytoskeletal protein CcmA (bactofilin family)